jgi:hypothetical protein
MDYKRALLFKRALLARRNYEKESFFNLSSSIFLPSGGF